MISVLDEPTTGLLLADVDRLLALLDRLIDLNPGVGHRHPLISSQTATHSPPTTSASTSENSSPSPQ
jgi:hypothetical protein